MATPNPQISKKMNMISGKVTLKHPGLGIPNLLVVVYDADRESPGSAGVSTATGAATGAAAAIMIGDRIGSVLTAADGTFSLSYDDADVREPSTTDLRPDLILMVLAPEDADRAESPKILYQTKVVRQNAGRIESYFIRLTERQLKDADIPIPNAEEESVPLRIEKYRALQQSRFRLNEGMADFHKEVLDVRMEEKSEFRTKIREGMVPTLPTKNGNGVVVKDGENILDKTTEVINKGIDHANLTLGAATSGVPVNLYLTPEDKGKLQHFFDDAVNGVAEIPEADIKPLLFKTSSSENIGTLLINNNPIAKYCRDKTFEETCAIEHVGETNGHTHNNGDGDNNGSGGSGHSSATEISLITGADIPTYIDRLVVDMPSPDTVLKPRAVPGRPNKADIEKSVNEFSLRKGPADVAAYYEFHSLQIAFEHVWKQLFDEEIVTSGYQLSQGLSARTGIKAVSLDKIFDLIKTAAASELAELPALIASLFEITKEEWNELSIAFRTQLSNLAVRIDVLSRGAVEVRDPNTGRFVYVPASGKDLTLKQFLIEQGERLIDSVRHDDYYTMHKTLRDLQERLSGRYEYTVFAADKDHSTVNFGLLNTFMQEWDPVNYQVGKLCKTIPLAPKEERKYSLKITKHSKRSEKQARKNNTSFTTEQTQTSRVEAEIVAKAINKTNFNLSSEGTYNIGISQGEAKTSLGVDAENESQQTRKDFREAVLKAVQEYKEERSIEVESEETSDSEYTDSGTITNPNDELAVTYLFYELQRRYRVSEQLYRVMPVVLVAQPVPQPHEITEAWVISNDWIIDRFLLDDSFKPALQYLSSKSVGDDFALRELRRNLRQQRNLVETLKLELSITRAEADNRYKALERAIRDRIGEESEEATDGWFSDVADFFGGGGQDPEAAKARELAAKDAHQYAMEKAEKMATAVQQEVDILHKLTAEYNKTLRDHLDNETRVRRLLVHLRNNILYYMQAIWSMEPPDQRFLRLQKVQVPDLVLDETSPNGGRTYRVQVNPVDDTLEKILATFRPEHTKKYRATMVGKLKKPFVFKPLIEIADLHKPVGFDGNYIIFPMKQHNALTEFMAAPYVDSAFGAMDPDELNNVNLKDFSKFICCMHDHDPDKFEELKPLLEAWLGQLLADPLRNGDEVVIPSGSLYIEVYPSAHGLLENFKQFHRELDVFKVQAEVRKLEMENLRLAARLLNAEREDPDVDKKIVVEANGLNMNIVPD